MRALMLTRARKRRKLFVVVGCFLLVVVCWLLFVVVGAVQQQGK